jgi:putative sigma-54 modulation protein
MRITFTARHFKTSDRLKEFATIEVQRLKKYYEPIIDTEIILDYIRDQQVAEIVVQVFGTTLKVVEQSEDMYKSITLAVDKLEQNLIKYKEKQRQFKNDRISENIQEEEVI